MSESSKDAHISLSLDGVELRDIAQALDMRIKALSDARPGFRCPAQARVHEVVDRVLDLRARIDYALKTLSKMPRDSAADQDAQAEVSAAILARLRALLARSGDHVLALDLRLLIAELEVDCGG